LFFFCLIVNWFLFSIFPPFTPVVGRAKEKDAEDNTINIAQTLKSDQISIEKSFWSTLTSFLE
jgi:hypothetical protein